MINVLKRGTAVFLLALFVAEAPLLASEIYAESNIIPANDSYEIDYDPDDPALNDDAYDIANKIRSSTMKLSATTC